MWIHWDKPTEVSPSYSIGRSYMKWDQFCEHIVRKMSERRQSEKGMGKTR